jgi:PAS domain S-box-containing protein
VRKVFSIGKDAPAAADFEARLQALDCAQALVRGLDGAITFWSRGMERLYGYCAAQALGQSAHHLLKTEFPSPLEHLEAELKERGEWTGELLQCRQKRPARSLGPHGEPNDIRPK